MSQTLHTLHTPCDYQDYLLSMFPSDSSDNDPPSPRLYFPVIYITEPSMISDRDERVSLWQLPFVLQEYTVDIQDEPDQRELLRKTHPRVIVTLDCSSWQRCIEECNTVVTSILEHVMEQLQTKYSKCDGCCYCNSRNSCNSRNFVKQSDDNLHRQWLRWSQYHRLRSEAPNSIEDYITYYRKTGGHFDVYVSLYTREAIQSSGNIGYVKQGSWILSKNFDDIRENVANITLQEQD